MNEELIDVVKDIAGSLTRENGVKWCSDIIDRLNTIQYNLKKEDDLAIRFGEFMKQRGYFYVGNLYKSTTELYGMFKKGEVKL